MTYYNTYKRPDGFVVETQGTVSASLRPGSSMGYINTYTHTASTGTIYYVDKGYNVVNLAYAAGAGAYTLSAGATLGTTIVFTAGTAQAHTVTNSSPGFNGGGAASDVATFAGAIGDGFHVVSDGTNWNVVVLKNVTLA